MIGLKSSGNWAQDSKDEQRVRQVDQELVTAYQAAKDGFTLEAWRAQRDYQVVAPREVRAGGTTLTEGEIQRLREVLVRSAGAPAAALSAEEHLLRGNGHYEVGQYNEAIAEYVLVIQLEPDNALAYANRGAAYDEKGEHDRAIGDYNEAIRLEPDYVLA